MTGLAPAENGRRLRARTDACSLKIDEAQSISEVVLLMGRIVADLQPAQPDPVVFGIGFPRAIATREDIEHWIVRLGPALRRGQEPAYVASLRTLFVRADARMNLVGPHRA